MLPNNPPVEPPAAGVEALLLLFAWPNRPPLLDPELAFAPPPKRLPPVFVVFVFEAACQLLITEDELATHHRRTRNLPQLFVS